MAEPIVQKKPEPIIPRDVKVGGAMKPDASGWESMKEQEEVDKRKEVLGGLKQKAQAGIPPKVPAQDVAPVQGVAPAQKPLPPPIVKAEDVKKTYVETQPFIMEARAIEEELRKFEDNPKLEKRKHRDKTTYGVKEYPR